MKTEVNSKNLIYIAQERAFATNSSSGWRRVIKPSYIKNGRLVSLNVSDELMHLIEEEQDKKIH